MKPPVRPFLRVPLRSLALASALALAFPVLAEDVVLSFDSDQHLPGASTSGDVELARTPKAARNATHALHPFGPSAPEFSYTGPKFSLGYEVRASEPSNLTVGPDKAVVEDNFQNGVGQRNDTISITAHGDWEPENTYSVAAVVVFPTAAFDLSSLSYSALNWTENKSYTEKLRHRWVVQTGGKYYVNVGFLGRTGARSEGAPVDVIAASRLTGSFDRWVPYDPAKSIFADLDAPHVRLGGQLSEVTAVGFYMDALEFQGAGRGKRQWQLRLITFQASGVPAASASASR